jgi:hypothetical protein
MVTLNLQPSFEIDKLRFNHCFRSPSLRHSTVLITGWVLTIVMHGLSNVILDIGIHKSEHFSKAYGFFGRARWTVESVCSEVY